MNWIIEHKAVVLGALFAISEVLALVPSIKSSGVFDFIYRTLAGALGKQIP